MAVRRAVKTNPKGATARVGVRPSKAAKPKAREAPPSVAPGATLEARIAALERERDELKAALEEERARRRKLEEVYAAARGRISRALESLRTILDGKR